MSRYVDIEGDWVDDAIKAYSLGYYEYDEYAIPIERFDSAPSIDIVFCKECEWEWTRKCPPHRMGLIHEADDFCSYGVRKESPLCKRIPSVEQSEQMAGKLEDAVISTHSNESNVLDTLKSKLTQAEKGKCPFDDPIPCEWVGCPNQTDCPWK